MIGKTKGRLVLAMGLAVLALGCLAPVAGATTEFPHGDESAENWQSVVTTYGWDPKANDWCETEWNSETQTPLNSCPFTFSASNWDFISAPENPYGTHHCKLDLAGYFTQDGSYTVTSANVGGTESACKNLKAQNLPWDGRACAYLGGGSGAEFWLRQEVDFLLYGQFPAQGATFGKFGSYGESLEFDVNRIGQSYFWHDGVFSSYEIGMYENEEGWVMPQACTWPEVS